MVINNAPRGSSHQVSPAAVTPVIASAAPPSWPCRRAAFPPGAAQSITNSALVVGHAAAASGSSLLRAVAPSSLAAAAAFALAPVDLLAARAGSRSRWRGWPGNSPVPGFFLPAVVMRAVGAAKLHREHVAAQKRVRAGDALSGRLAR